VSAEIRIVMADDHPIFRQGLRQIIETDRRLNVVGEAEDGEAALGLIRELRPDVAVLDVSMPVRDGFDVARQLQDERLLVGIIFLTMHRDEHFLDAALGLGVKGYVLKDSAIIEIINSIKAVAAGQDYISPALSTYLIKRSTRAAALAEQKPVLDQLTPTERRVLKLVAEGRTSREIADEMNIGVRTVEHHRSNIASKLELKGSHALVKFAVKHQSEL
jgi:DNA-binding NarL/FixJ family response regulator